MNRRASTWTTGGTRRSCELHKRWLRSLDAARFSELGLLQLEAVGDLLTDEEFEKRRRRGEPIPRPF